MTSFANLGVKPPVSSKENAPKGRICDAGGEEAPEFLYKSFTESHDPDAKDLLRRYLSDVYGNRTRSNAGLRDLEKKLEGFTAARPLDAAASGDDTELAPDEQPMPPLEAYGEDYAYEFEAENHIAHIEGPAIEPDATTAIPSLDQRLKELSEYLHEDLSHCDNSAFVDGTDFAGGQTQNADAGDIQEAPKGADPDMLGTEQEFADLKDVEPIVVIANVDEVTSSEKNSAESIPPMASFAYSQHPAAAPTAERGLTKLTPNAPVLDRQWFEERFASMRQSIDTLADQIPMQRIAALEAQFAQLMTRLEERDSTPAMAAVEAGLKNLATYLDDNKQWNKEQDERVRGVEERLDRLTGLVEQSHAALSETAKGIEVIAKQTGPGFSAQTADIIAERLEPHFKQLDQKDSVTDLGGEVARLSAQSAEFARNANERLKLLQNSLDEGLDRIEAFDEAAQLPLTPANRLIQDGDQAADDDYNGKMIAAARRAARLADGPEREGVTDGDPLRYQIPYGEFLPEDKTSNSRGVLVAAAVILLLASAAMLYFNLRDNLGDEKLSSAWLSQYFSEAAETPETGPLNVLPVKTETILLDDGKEKVSSKKHLEPLMVAVAAYADHKESGQRQPISELTTGSVRLFAYPEDADASFSGGKFLLGGDDADSVLPTSERFTTAARRFYRAAEKGHAPSQYRLGTLYELGQGAPKNRAKAMAWYRRAAISGHVKAMHNLAVLSVLSDNPTKDYGQAAEWFRKAAGHGLRDSQYNLGLLYERGLGVEKDPVKAYGWISLAAKQGDEKAEAKKRLLAAHLSALELARAEAVAKGWSAQQVDEKANRHAPVPPIRKPQIARHVAKPELGNINLMRASWAPEIASMDGLVAEIQSLLSNLGYKPGPVDGIVGPKTRAAIRAFQQSAGLPSTGKISKKLLAKLNVGL